MKINTRQRTMVKVEKELKLTDYDILNLLHKAGVEVPDDCEVVFTTPGGGDWSNTDIDIDAEYPITVRWVEKQDDV